MGSDTTGGRRIRLLYLELDFFKYTLANLIGYEQKLKDDSNMSSY